jgi:hypothetical protein
MYMYVIIDRYIRRYFDLCTYVLYACKYTFVYVYIYKSLCIFSATCASIYVCLFLKRGTHVSVFESMYAYIHIRIYVCVCRYAVYLNTCVYTCLFVFM